MVLVLSTIEYRQIFLQDMSSYVHILMVLYIFPCYLKGTVWKGNDNERMVTAQNQLPPKHLQKYNHKIVQMQQMDVKKHHYRTVKACK